MNRKTLRAFPWAAAVAGGIAFGATAFVLRKRMPAPSRIALIGDSYAMGLGPELSKLINTFKYEGRVGSGTYAWLKLPAWLGGFRPDLVLVSLGVNDGPTPNAANYATIVRAIAALGARTVWIEPPAAVPASAARAIIASLGLLTVAATMTPLSADRLHPISYVPWANEIRTALS